MKRILLLLFISGMSALSFAQSTQKGVVKEYNDAKKKTPLAGVELVVNNAGSNVSGKDGRFTLSFRTLKPGDKVDVRRIMKAGYEIFNKEALDAWRISNDGSTFTIVLCKSSKFKALKDQYNAVASKSYAQQQKKDEDRLANLLKEGKLQQAEYEKKLKELKDKYDEQLENLDNYIDHFARIDLETLSREEQRIIEMVKEGKIEEAIKAYEDMHLEDKYAQAVENISMANNAITQLSKVKSENAKTRDEAFAAVMRMNNARRLQGGEENYRKIGESLKRLADSDTTQLVPLYEYALFSAGQNDIKEASKYYDIILLNETDIENKATTLQRYSNACVYENPAKSLRMALESTHILDSLIRVGQNVEKNKIRLRQTYNSLANNYVNQNDKNQAKYYYLLSLKLLKEQGMNDLRDKSNYTTINHNLGFLYTSEGKYKEAIEVLTEAYDTQLTVLEESVTTDNKNILFNCAQQLGYTYGKVNNMDSCKLFFDKSVVLYQELIKENPQAFTEKGASLYNNIGAIYLNRHFFTEAEEAFSKALGCAEAGFAETQSLQNKINIIVIRGALGASITKISGRSREGLNLIEQSLVEINPYYSKYKEVLKPFYVILLLQKSNALIECQDYETAMNTIDEAFVLLPVNADSWDIKGYIYTKLGNWDEAAKCWKKVVEINPDFLTQCESDLYNALKAKGILSE